LFFPFLFQQTPSFLCGEGVVFAKTLLIRAPSSRQSSWSGSVSVYPVDSMMSFFFSKRGVPGQRKFKRRRRPPTPGLSSVSAVATCGLPNLALFSSSSQVRFKLLRLIPSSRWCTKLYRKPQRSSLRGAICAENTKKTLVESKPDLRLLSGRECRHNRAPASKIPIARLFHHFGPRIT